MSKKYFRWKNADCNGQNIEWEEMNGSDFFRFFNSDKRKGRYAKGIPGCYGHRSNVPNTRCQHKNRIPADPRRKNMLHQGRSCLPYSQGTSFHLSLHRLLKSKMLNRIGDILSVSARMAYTVCRSTVGVAPTQERRTYHYGGRTPS